MSEEKILIEIIGHDADECAQVLSEMIYAEFGSQPEKCNLKDQHASDGAGKKMDPGLIGAIAGAVSATLAFPVAVLTAIQIKDRLGKKKSFEQLVERGRELKRTKRISTIRFRIGTIEIEIEKATFAEISNLAGKSS